MKKVEEPKTVVCSIYLKGRTEYTMEFNKFETQRTIKQEDIQKDFAEWKDNVFFKGLYSFYSKNYEKNLEFYQKNNLLNE